MLSGGQDVELFATVRAMAVADDPELLEDVEGPIDGRGDRVRVARTTPVDELGTGHMAVDLGQDLDEDPPLRASSAAPWREAGPGYRPMAGRGQVRQSRQ